MSNDDRWIDIVTMYALHGSAAGESWSRCPGQCAGWPPTKLHQFDFYNTICFYYNRRQAAAKAT